MPKKTDKDRLSGRDDKLIDYILDHPMVAETTCATEFGYAKGSTAKVLKRLREEIDKRRAQRRAVVEDKKTTILAINRAAIEQRAMELAMLEPLSQCTITGQVNSLRLLAEMGGHIIQKTIDLGEMFKNKSPEQLEYFAIHGCFPPVDSGKSGPTEPQSSR